ncbi:ATP-binding protein [Ascidiimonas sp. W6]|uniref:ATP-binding protein n=1 Tax=Ascidiimonas meishanensis TaxID=3128903 RepID=UPI0030EF5EA9
MEIIKENTIMFIDREFEWFEKVIERSLTCYFQNEKEANSIYELAPPVLNEENDSYANFIKGNKLSFEERIVLMLGMSTYLKPQSLDVFLIKNQNLGTHFTEFGGIVENKRQGFIPTLETAAFVLGGSEMKNRMHFLSIFSKDHFFFTKGIMEVDKESDFLLHQRLQPTNKVISLFTTGEEYLPQYSAKFPAKEIATELSWNDLILDSKVLASLNDIKEWLLHSDKILNDWGLKQHLKAGLRALFYGTPGTGKTMAATLLGKETKRPVFRVDLSLVVSKYIGETEKNLGQLFDEAEDKQWILFFDEADALFGKRTQTKGANDRYANQEVAYLLQRIEDFSGLVILATNIQTNIDEAFARRFQYMIHFPKPDVTQRERLWKKLFEEKFDLAANVCIKTLAEKYELSGGEMINVLRYCALEAAKRNEKFIPQDDILVGVQREYRKLNKTI